MKRLMKHFLSAAISVIFFLKLEKINIGNMIFLTGTTGRDWKLKNKEG
jgi:hypothetical protein